MGMVPPRIIPRLWGSAPRKEAQPKQEHPMAEELEVARQYVTWDQPVGRLSASCDPLESSSRLEELTKYVYESTVSTQELIEALTPKRDSHRPLVQPDPNRAFPA